MAEEPIAERHCKKRCGEPTTADLVGDIALCFFNADRARFSTNPA